MIIAKPWSCRQHVILALSILEPECSVWCGFKCTVCSFKCQSCLVIVLEFPDLALVTVDLALQAFNLLLVMVNLLLVVSSQRSQLLFLLLPARTYRRCFLTVLQTTTHSYCMCADGQGGRTWRHTGVLWTLFPGILQLKHARLWCSWNVLISMEVPVGACRNAFNKKTEAMLLFCSQSTTAT